MSIPAQGQRMALLGETESFLGFGKRAKERRAFRKEKRKIRLDNKRSKIEARKTDNQVKSAQASMLTAVGEEKPVQAGASSNLTTIAIVAIALLLIGAGVFMVIKK